MNAPLAPPLHCPFCGQPVDPLQAATPDGGCPRPDCRRRARAAAARRDDERARRRHDEARRSLGRAGVDPDREPWQVVPRNDAAEVPLPAAVREGFRRHLERLLDGSSEARAAGRRRRRPRPSAPPAPLAPAPAPGAEPPDGATLRVLARGCATCRGWCCRRGGSHAFLDEASVARVRSHHPEWSRAELIEAYLQHAGPTHLAGGCVFQGPAGCRLPQSLRSDWCTQWWCEDLAPLVARARRGRGPTDALRFVAVASDPG